MGRATGTVEGMTRANGEQRHQRTVAELLAEYGGQVDGGRRHRHRRPDQEAEEAVESDLTTTAPQAIIERVHSESPEVDWKPARNGHSHAYGTRNGTVASPPPAPPTPPPAQSAPPKSAPPKSAPPPAPPKSAPPKSAPPPPAPPAGALSARLDGAVEAPPTRRWERRPPPEAEHSTDQFEVYAEPEAFDPEPWRNDDLEAARLEHDYEADFDDPAVVDDHDYDVGYDSDQDRALDEVDERTPGQQWLAVAGQLALGVIGGAVVWLLFNWLWVQIPAVALGAALLVIVGLVWIVRRMRRAEDLQTTVLAVLVGLVVTVSPAAMLLLDR